MLDYVIRIASCRSRLKSYTLCIPRPAPYATDFVVARAVLLHIMVLRRDEAGDERLKFHLLSLHREGPV
jgi:hypothetical protein